MTAQPSINPPPSPEQDATPQAETAARVTPMMEQYLEIKAAHPGLLLFYRMGGVPVERSDDYLHRLIAKGFRVAVCEQMEDPAAARARGNKSVVKRDVVRLVTPGTLTEDTLLDARANNYLLAIVRA